MAMTFVGFVIYGVAASALRRHVIERPSVVQRVRRRSSAASFIGLGVKLADGDLALNARSTGSDENFGNCSSRRRLPPGVEATAVALGRTTAEIDRPLRSRSSAWRWRSATLASVSS